MNTPQFTADEECLKYEQLLHYTNSSVLQILLNSGTLKCNSLKNVNDKLERARKGLENLTDGFYISCFCHYQYEIVPFWFMYGGDVPDNEKVLLRFKNFASFFDKAIENDWATTSEKKCIFFNPEKLFLITRNGLSCCPTNDPKVENRQTIKSIKLFDVKYLPPKDEAFLKQYKSSISVSLGDGQETLPAEMQDARSIGKEKTIHWEYEAETRIQCTMYPVGSYYSDYILLRLKEEVFRDMVIVANPWATDEFIFKMLALVKESTLSETIKRTIAVTRSDMDGQIVGRK